MKACTKCGEVKPLSEYHIAKQRNDGHKSECKTCAKAYRREYYLITRERQIKRVTEFKRVERTMSGITGEIFREKIRLQGQRYVERNREKVNAYQREYQRKRKLQNANSK